MGCNYEVEVEGRRRYSRISSSRPVAKAAMSTGSAYSAPSYSASMRAAHIQAAS